MPFVANMGDFQKIFEFSCGRTNSSIIPEKKSPIAKFLEVGPLARHGFVSRRPSGRRGDPGTVIADQHTYIIDTTQATTPPCTGPDL